MKPIRLLIADDSATLRAALEAILAEDERIEVVGHAVNGQEAVALARSLRPDVITMDVVMPVMDGVQATQAIMASAPARILMVCSVGEGRQVDLSFRAMAAGALELIAKPSMEGGQALRAWGRRVAEAIILMSEIPVVTRYPRSTRESSNPGGPTGLVGALAIAASTGGPPALALLLGQFPERLPIPILVAQHLAPGFTPGLVRYLAESTRLRVRIVTQSVVAEAGCVYLPPDGKDLSVDAEGVLHALDARALHVPSCNHLLSAVADAYGARACALILTGMGDDGTLGAQAIRRAGGRVFAQDEASCVVYGMPHAAFKSGGVSAVLPLQEMPAAVLQLLGRER